VKGYSKVIYSGFPTIELSRIIIDYVLEEKQISGIYHVSSDPISKYELLCLIAETYKKKTVIEAYNEFALDRSLDSSCFRELTGYSPPAWSELVKKMYLDYREHEAVYLVSEQNG
jgi:dTDP-4-dehydrorhamnose reductase